MAHRFFEGDSHAAIYSKFRPTYSSDVLKRIVQYVKEQRPSCSHAVDVGCGSGQFTQLLAEEFDQVVGVDISAAQVSEANKTKIKPNVVYRVGSAESVPVPDESADLVTAASAAHWFDLKKFYAEVDRVLKPNGCVALVCYVLPVIKSTNSLVAGELQNALLEFYDVMYSHECLNSCKSRKDISQNRYVDVILPYKDTTRDDSFEVNYETSMSGYINLVRTLSIYQKYITLFPNENDPVLKLQDSLMSIVGAATSIPEETKVQLTYPIFCVLGRKPGK